MNTPLDKLRDYITKQAANPNFRHHRWFIKWYLEIVEQLALDLLKHYPEANKDITIALCWMHDYGKIIDFDTQYSHDHVEAGRLAMIDLGFDLEFADTVSNYVKILDRKENLERQDIEVRIVSSADACSHLTGPFVSLYWHENPDKPFEEIMSENARKISHDWSVKVTIPEAKTAYQSLYELAIANATGETRRI